MNDLYCFLGVGAEKNRFVWGGFFAGNKRLWMAELSRMGRCAVTYRIFFRSIVTYRIH
jgi:hypothetical protein